MQFHEKKFFLEKFWSLFVFPSEDIRLWQVLITLVICSDTSSIASIASSEESDKGFLARSSHLGECLKKDKKMLCIKNTRQYYDAVFRKKFFDFRVVSRTFSSLSISMDSSSDVVPDPLRIRFLFCWIFVGTWHLFLGW